MEYYYLNRNIQPESWDYEVHRTNNCSHPAKLENQINLWLHTDCYSAVREAKSKFPDHATEINWCYYCCIQCHTT